jgi:hypothetical protein
MATKRKTRRARGNQKATKEREALARKKAEDAYDFDIRRHNFERSNFYSLILDACRNPEEYRKDPAYRGTDVARFAYRLEIRKMTKTDREALANLLDICRRTKLVDNKST